MRKVYGLLCVLGAAWPLAHFVPWVERNGLAIPLLVREAFGTPIAAFAWSDVAVSAIVVLAFIWTEGRRLAMRRLWLPTLGMAVGVSLALPLFLWLRERHLAASRDNAAR